MALEKEKEIVQVQTNLEIPVLGQEAEFKEGAGTIIAPTLLLIKIYERFS
jgi:hypothetical protein